MRPRCTSVGGEGYRCRRRGHGPDIDHTAVGWCGQMLWDDESAIEPRTQIVGTPWGTYDVAALAKLAQGHPVGLVDVTRAVEPDAVNRSWWRGVDVHTPVVFVEHSLVDGRHRVYKAWRQRRSTVPAIFLTAQQAAPALLSQARVDQLEADHQAFQNQFS